MVLSYSYLPGHATTKITFTPSKARRSTTVDSLHTMGSKEWIGRANAAVARSAVGKYFRLEGSGHVS